MKACLPCFKFPEDWHATFAPTHWSNEEKILQSVDKIIVPYAQSKCRELKLPEYYPTLPSMMYSKASKLQALPQFLKGTIFTLLMYLPTAQIDSSP